MGHYAQVENGKVVTVIKATKSFIDKYGERLGGNWIKTSYNTRGGVHHKPHTQNPSESQEKSLRKNFAGIGYEYDSEKDAFIPPKPLESWVLNEDTCLWEPPTPPPGKPEDWGWDEDKKDWFKLD